MPAHDKATAGPHSWNSDEVQMKNLHFFARIALLGFIALGAAAVSGQDYPRKPIRIIAPGVGGANDFAARMIAPGLSGALNQPVIADNRGSLVAGEIAAKAQPDGYTLLVANGTLWLRPLLEDVPDDIMARLAPITLAVSTPNIVVAHPSLPVHSIKELIALAKANPGELNYASGPPGSSNHLAAELFKSMASVNIVRIAFKSSGPAINDMLAGQVKLMFPNATGVTPHLKSGRLRGLAVTSAEPSALAPGLPTVAASGLPGYESGTLVGLFAPAKTPVIIIERLNREIVRVLNQSEVKEKFFNTGADVVGSTPQQLTAAVRSEVTKLGKVIKESGIRTD